MANNKWELGVVTFHDSMEPVDRVTRLQSDYAAAPSDINSLNSLALDTSVTDYTASPYHLYSAHNGLPGSFGFVGPSTHATYEGAIEGFAVSSLSNSNRTVYPLKGATGSTLSFPYSAYAASDPVIFRTLPAGWSPPATHTLETLNIGAEPVGRTSLHQNINQQQGTYSNTIDSENAYKYQNKFGLRLSTGDSSSNTNRYIYRDTPINSMTNSIPRYRLAWNYRFGQYSEGSSPVVGQMELNIKAEMCDAAGTALTTLTNETSSGLVSTSQDIMKKTAMSTTLKDWSFDYALIGGVGDGSYSTYNRTSLTQWYFKDNSDNFKYSPYNRMNRLKIKIGAFRGINLFFDIDDVIVEHAGGTSQEKYGFYEIDDFPTQGSVNWAIRQGATSRRNITSNNIMKINQTFGDQPPKFQVNAQFNNVKRQTYDDMRVLEEWQKRNHMISLRTFNDGLPDVMVGFITLSSYSNELPDLNRVSFSFRFEEA